MNETIVATIRTTMPATMPEDKLEDTPEEGLGLPDGLGNATAGDVVTGALLVSTNSLGVKSYLGSRRERH